MKIILSVFLLMLSQVVLADECMMDVDADGVKVKERVCAIAGAKDNDKLKDIYVRCECEKLKKNEEIVSTYEVASHCANDRSVEGVTESGVKVQLQKSKAKAE